MTNLAAARVDAGTATKAAGEIATEATDADVRKRENPPTQTDLFILS